MIDLYTTERQRQLAETKVQDELLSEIFAPEPAHQHPVWRATIEWIKTAAAWAGLVAIVVFLCWLERA
jgi:hypothetical protein